jgi:molecular chaperone GrpE
MSAKHESQAASELEQDSGVEQAPEPASQPDPGSPGTGNPDPGNPGTGNPDPGNPGNPDPDRQPEPPQPSTPAGEPEAPTGPANPSADAQGASAAQTTAQPEQQPDDDHEVKLERDLEELTAKAQKADEYLELAQRTKADFENYRKRAARESAAAQERGVAKLAKELLPAVDNLDRALAAAQSAQDGQTESNGNLVDGIKLVHADVIAALARVGIEPFSPRGEQFDPQHHEAVAQQPVEGAEPGTIVEVYQCGYRFGENVLRPARVVVAG